MRTILEIATKIGKLVQFCICTPSKCGFKLFKHNYHEIGDLIYRVIFLLSDLLHTTLLKL